MKSLQIRCALLAIAAFASSAAAEDHILSLYQNPPATTQATDPPLGESASGFVDFISNRFSAHEPVYFLYWPDSPDIKFQFSLKYRLFGLDDLWKPLPAGTDGLYVAYTQTSLWDIHAPSSPFYDNSYKPELLYEYAQADPHWLPGMTRFDLQLSLQHESNGKEEPDSRALNVVYIRPIFTFGHPGNRPVRGKGYFITVAPRLWVYAGKSEDNEDIADFRGYGDVRVVAGQRDGFQLAVTGRAGEKDLRNGALQIDASYPVKIGGKPSFYLYAQYFVGYGEALIDYNESGSSFRVGLALVR